MGWSNDPVSFAAVLVSQLFLAGAAVAQAPAGEPKPADDQPTTAQDAEAGTPRRAKKAAEEEIVVTGSRVRRKDLTTPAPITVLNKEQIQASGRISIGDFLQTLPEQGNAVNTSVNNGSTGSGATRVSLRGLGAERTLVLMNGRRFVPGGPGANGSVDLSSIPIAAIERIEVLKDGASAVYGSDAIGGVINLITRKRMNGVDMSGYAGTSTHNDGARYDLNAVAGTSGDRGSVLFAGGWAQENTVWAGARDFAAVPRIFSTTGTGLVSGRPGVSTQGSGTVPAGTVILGPCRPPPAPQNTPCIGRQLDPGTDPRRAFYNSLISRYPTTGNFIHTTPDDPQDHLCNAAGTSCWRPFTTTELQSNGGDGYNFQPQNYLVTPQQRIQLFSIGETKLGESARGYFEGSYVNRQGGQTLAPEPFLSDIEGVSVNANNAYNPFGVTLPAVRKRLTEFGTRDFRQDIDTFRLVAGVDGTLPEEAGVIKGWFWDASVNFGRTVASNTKRGNLYIPAVQEALGASAPDGQGGLDPTRCATGNPDCVPLNLFGGPDSIQSNQITPIIAYTGNQRGYNQMVAAQFNTAGELFRLLAERPLGLALGYEYRIVSGQNIPDPITVAGLTTGNKGAITGGHYYVNEGYGELSIPIVSGMPFAESVEGTAAVRVFNYSNFGTDSTYKFGGRWTIIRDFTIRGTYSTGFRAPSIPDLFQGAGDAFPSASDPCRGPSVPGGGPVPQSCINAGIPGTGTGDTQTQLRARIGGNPALLPEKAKIYTGGVVYEPRWLRGFSATLDYYNIAITKAITNIGAQLILNACYPSDPNTAPRFCDLVQRDPSTLRVSNIIDINQNIGKDETDGIDLGLNYLFPTDVGRFNLIFDGTWLHKFDRTLVDGSVIHGKNTYDISTIGGIYPAFKFIAGVRWSLSGLDVGVNTRFFSAFHECGTRTGLFNGTSTCYDRQQPGDVGVNSITSRGVSAYNAWDLFLSYGFKNFAGRTTVAAGVNNIFNAQPPTIYNGFLAASDPTAYADAYLGRFFYGRVAQSF
jgi:outer membrane receptor protein involved in Fe transport